MTGDDFLTPGIAVVPGPTVGTPAVQAAAVLAFGPYHLHADPVRLYRNEDDVRLGGRALDLLMALVSRPGDVLSRGELEAQVWPHSVVEDSSLRVTDRDLLSDDRSLLSGKRFQGRQGPLESGVQGLK